MTETSNALDLEVGVFALDRPQAIAASLKRSADASTRRKSSSYRSAMAMLVFYLNRAGRKLGPTRRRTLEAAKGELRALYGRTRETRNAKRAPRRPKRSAGTSGAGKRPPRRRPPHP